jgi:CYTH domain-containing protein
MATATDFLSTYLDPIAEELTPQQAERILATKPSHELVARVEVLGDKANLGTLTEQERAEYEYYIDVDEAISLLKAKARDILSRPAS